MFYSSSSYIGIYVFLWKHWAEFHGLGIDKNRNINGKCFLTCHTSPVWELKPKRRIYAREWKSGIVKGFWIENAESS